jgi:hypothetical protein
MFNSTVVRVPLSLGDTVVIVLLADLRAHVLPNNFKRLNLFLLMELTTHSTCSRLSSLKRDTESYTARS